MLLIAGIVPDEDQPLVMGTVVKEGADLIIDGHQIPCTQGTAAMLGAALAVTTYLNTESPKALLIGDTGKGKGSKDLYDYLIKNINTIKPDVLALHYWMPNIYQMQDLMEAIQTCSKIPVLIADAASMYAAKAAGRDRVGR